MSMPISSVGVAVITLGESGALPRLEGRLEGFALSALQQAGVFSGYDSSCYTLSIQAAVVVG